MAVVTMKYPAQVLRWQIQWSNGEVSRPYGGREYAEYDAEVRTAGTSGLTYKIVGIMVETIIFAPRVRACGGCGELTTRGHWCSNSCYYADEGYPDREE